MRRGPGTGAGRPGAGAGMMLSPIWGAGRNGTWLQQMVPLGLATLRYIRRGRCFLLGRRDRAHQPGKGRWWVSCQGLC